GATYEVNLFVRNGFDGTSEADERIFDIEIEGTEYFTDIDLSETYGHQVAAMLTQTLTVNDDSLDIEFLHDVDNPLINAIEIVQINGDVTPANTVSIAADANALEAGDVSGQFIVSLSAAVTSDTEVTYSVGGTATADSDYSALSGTVTIAAGATSAIITVPVLPDNEIEGDETVIVTLTGASGDATLGDASQASILIEDDEVANTVSILASQDGGEPTNAGEFTVSLEAIASQDTVISYSVSGTATADSDYSALSGTVTIVAGQTTAAIAVPVLEDGEGEGDETVVVTLDAITSGDADVVLGAANEATVTIIDDEIIPETVTFEAEAADTLLGDYIGGVEDIGVASGGQVLSFVKGASGESGSAVFNLDELTGTSDYDIVLGTYDESDGTASFTIFVNDAQVGELLLDQSLGSNVANAQTFITETVSFGVTLSPGDVLTVNAFEDADEHARLDFLQLVPVGSI
ncbi:MAG: Calx-beta domain-containing protein, partial [Leptolyngbyaceae cyanobacterium]